VVALAVASPVLLAMLRDLTNRQLDPLPDWGGAPYYSADVFSYLVPSKFNPVTGSWFESVYDRVTAGEKFRFVGWTVLALAFIAALKWVTTWKRIIIAMRDQRDRAHRQADSGRRHRHPQGHRRQDRRELGGLGHRK
jgi:hypothetical protein